MCLCFALNADNISVTTHNRRLILRYYRPTPCPETELQYFTFFWHTLSRRYVFLKHVKLAFEIHLVLSAGAITTSSEMTFLREGGMPMKYEKKQLLKIGNNRSDRLKTLVIYFCQKFLSLVLLFAMLSVTVACTTGTWLCSCSRYQRQRRVCSMRVAVEHITH